MQKKSIILGLSLLLLSACGEGASTSNSASTSHGSTSTSTSTTTPSSSGPSVSSSLPETSTSTSTSTSTGTSTSDSTNSGSTDLPKVAEKSIRFSAESLKESLPTVSSSEETVVSADGMEIGFVSAKYGTYSDSKYIMFYKTSDANGAGHMYNKTSLGHISSIVVKFSASTSTNVVMGVTFGDDVMSEAKTTFTKSEQATVSGIVTITNESETGDYFNISVTNNYNLQIEEMVINLNGASETITA